MTTFKTLTFSLLSAVVMGASCFVFGFMGPLIFFPEANQGPLLGIFITGPAGFAIGGLAGWIIASRKNDQTIEGNLQGANKTFTLWKRVLSTFAVIAVILIVVGYLQVPLHQAKFSPSVSDQTDIENRDSSLKELNVRFLEDEDLLLLRKFAHLHSLDFQGGWGVDDAKVTDEGLKNLASLKLTKLGKILLGYCLNISDDGMSFLAQMKSLHHLNLNDCPQITDKGLAILATSKSIKKLNLTNCIKITDNGLKHLKQMKQLKEIRLFGCTKLSKRAIHKLRKNLPKAKIWSDYKTGTSKKY